jgi:hypothetical protein
MGDVSLGCTFKEPSCLGWKRCSATRILPSQEGSYADAQTTGSAAGRMIKVKPTGTRVGTASVWPWRSWVGMSGAQILAFVVSGPPPTEGSPSNHDRSAVLGSEVGRASPERSGTTRPVAPDHDPTGHGHCRPPPFTGREEMRGRTSLVCSDCAVPGRSAASFVVGVFGGVLHVTKASPPAGPGQAGRCGTATSAS